ncbi:MAG TPA: HEAT repeat domain-containing protein [Bryobacteraceae bacterium]|nr:HEAT repeat domain-containing protein [Bryobacteraceae bacterium]
MIVSRTLIPMSCLLVTGAVAWSQTPAAAPTPMIPMAPRVAATPAAAPAAPAPAQAARPVPAPRAIMDPEEMERLREMAEDAREQASRAMAVAPPAQIDPEQMEHIRQMAEDARQQAWDAQKFFPDAKIGGQGWGAGFGKENGNFNFDFKINTPMAFAQNMTIKGRGNDDRLYDSGLRALDSNRWDEALEDFNQVASHAAARADGALYWKAYALNRLGRRDEAKAAIAELRKSYASSRWLDDAKALEIQVAQESGKPVSPEAESDEQLKLMALNGLMQSDPDRAIPLVENILKGSGSHRLKAQALFVLAQNSSPRAQQIVEQIAKGSGNPDLQVRAIEYLGQKRKLPNNSQNQLLMEIYNSTSDTRVKSAILSALGNSRDIDRLGQIAKLEKNADLRERTYDQLGRVDGQPELWQIYQAETTPEGKIAILRYMHSNGNADKLVEVIKRETDPRVRRAAIEALSTQQNGAPERLVSIYSSEQDPELRKAVVNALSNQRNAKYLVDLARAEKDPKLKLQIVDRLSNMHSKEASDYLMEILSK